MTYRERVVSISEYNKLLEYYEILLLNNHAFFIGLSFVDEESTVKRIARKEFPKFGTDDIVPIEAFRYLDQAVSELEVEDYKISKFENMISSRFLTNSSVSAKRLGMEKTKKHGIVKSYFVAGFILVRSWLLDKKIMS